MIHHRIDTVWLSKQVKWNFFSQSWHGWNWYTFDFKQAKHKKILSWHTLNWYTFKSKQEIRPVNVFSCQHITSKIQTNVRNRQNILHSEYLVLCFLVLANAKARPSCCSGGGGGDGVKLLGEQKWTVPSKILKYAIYKLNSDLEPTGYIHIMYGKSQKK